MPIKYPHCLIVEPRSLVSAGISKLLFECLPGPVITSIDLGYKAIEMLSRDKYDLVVISPEIVDLDFRIICLKCTRLFMPACVVISEGNAPLISATALTGIKGIVFADDSEGEIKECFKKTLNGHYGFSLQVTSLTVLNSHAGQPQLPIRVSDKKATIIELISLGKKSIEIARTLNVKEKTVIGYKEELFEMTRTKNSPHLVRYALENKLLKLSRTAYPPVSIRDELIS